MNLVMELSVSEINILIPHFFSKIRTHLLQDVHIDVPDADNSVCGGKDLMDCID
jgi:hypothetical protein